jgi:HAD superfamily hydrolase (TIGR01490 family)
MPSKLPHLSLFDLDHTLLKANASFKFGAFLYHQNVFSFPIMLKLVGTYFLHHLNFIGLEEVHKRIFKTLFLGRTFSSIQQFIQPFLKEEIPPLLFSPVIERLNKAKVEGHYTAILSSSPDFLVKNIAEFLGVDAWYGTQYIVENQCFCRLASIMQGEEKAAHLKILSDRLGISSLNTTVYSDSYLDLPFLKAAGKAVAVNPDKKLRAICVEREWEIL